MSRVRLESLSKSYGAQVVGLEKVSLSVEEGELLSVLGPSGSGKSTLLRIVGGLLEPDEGTVWFNERDMTQVPANYRNVGFVFQDLALFPHLRVQENIAFGLEARGVGKAARKKRVAEMLDFVELTGKERRFPAQLSGGERQRVAIARALATDPDVLLLDEPLSALDRRLRDTLKFTIQSLQRASGKTTIYVTHDQSEAFAIADRIAVMDRGRIEQVGTAEALYISPATRFVADFIGSFNKLPGRVLDQDGNQARVRSGAAVISGRTHQPLQPEEEVLLYVRPENVSLLQGEVAGNGHLRGTVRRAIFEGAVLEAWVDVGGQVLRVELRGDERRDFVDAVGKQVALRFENVTVLPLHEAGFQVAESEVDLGEPEVSTS